MTNLPITSILEDIVLSWQSWVEYDSSIISERIPEIRTIEESYNSWVDTIDQDALWEEFQAFMKWGDSTQKDNPWKFWYVEIFNFFYTPFRIAELDATKKEQDRIIAILNKIEPKLVLSKEWKLLVEDKLGDYIQRSVIQEAIFQIEDWQERLFWKK